MRRFIGLMLALAMIFTILPSMASADDDIEVKIINTHKPSGIRFSKFKARIEFGDLVCKGTISDGTKRRIPVYIKGYDINDILIEAAGYTVDMYPKESKNVELRLKSGLFIERVEIGYMEKSGEDIDICAYGIRRDDRQNRIIVTAAVRNNTKSSYPKDKIIDKRYGGVVARGKGSDGKIVEVQCDSKEIPNGGGDTFELIFLAGSMIKKNSDIFIRSTGDSDRSSVDNMFGTRKEKGKTIVTGCVENNPYSQYIQVVATGTSGSKEQQVEGQTLAIERYANKGYKFELNENNNVNSVGVKITDQKSMAGTGKIMGNSTPRIEGKKMVIDSLVSSGYYTGKNLGVIVTGYDRGKTEPGRIPIETNVSMASFDPNKFQMKHVVTTLDGGDKIKPENIELKLAGDLENTIMLRNYAYRIENGTYSVTSIIENGNTVPQTAGVQVSGYDDKGSIIEITGYSDLLKANDARQYKSVLMNSRAIKKVSVNMVDILKNQVSERHAMYKDEEGITVSGILMSGSREHNAGFVAMAKDANGVIVDADCYYNLLKEDSVNPFYLKLNDPARISKVDTYIMDEMTLKPELRLEGSGSYTAKGKIQINGIVANGTTLEQETGLISMGYDENNKLVDISSTKSVKMKPLSVQKLLNNLDETEKVKRINTLIYGVPCKTALLGQTVNKNNGMVSYKACLQNGAGDQDFSVQVMIYDSNGKLKASEPQTLSVKKYGAATFKTNFSTRNVSKVLVKFLDASKNQIKNPTGTDLVYPVK